MSLSMLYVASSRFTRRQPDWNFTIADDNDPADPMGGWVLRLMRSHMNDYH